MSSKANEVSNLQISSTLELPVEAATGRFVALGKSGSGKTNAGTVIAEELLTHGVTIAILDVLGNMHGLRAAGDGDGLSIAILGGLHGDVPLRADRGAVVADLVASGVSAIIDLSQMIREDAQQFAADFFDRLVPAVRISGRNVHVIVEEAETFAPQSITSKSHNASRAATTVFARTARNVGIGWTFSTQRPQLLSKEVIDSATAFIAMKMTGDLAQAAIGAEVRSRVGKTIEVQIIGDLPKLRRGEAWLVPDPDWLGDDREAAPEKFQFRWRHTFDSARPPKVGERREEPRLLADVDLAGLRDAMASDIATSKDVEKSEARVERVEVPVLLRSEIEDLRTVASLIGEQMAGFVEVTGRIGAVIDRLTERLEIGLGRVSTSDARPEALKAPIGVPPKSDRGSKAVPPAREVFTAAGHEMSKACRALLDELVTRHPMRLTKQQLAAMSGRSAKSSQFGPSIRELIATGFVHQLGHVFALTEAGTKLSDFGVASSPKQIIETWLRVLPPSASRMYRALVDADRPLTRAELAQRADISLTSSGFNIAVKDLRINQLAEIHTNGTIVGISPQRKRS